MGPSHWRHTLYAHMNGRPQPSLWSSFALAPLWPASYLYRLLVASHHASYTYGLRRCQRLPCKVVSIGNLTLGGTGKTQLTIWMAHWLHQRGWRVAVLSRGYGGGGKHGKGQMQVVSTGKGPLIDWQHAGDEPYLLAQRLPGIPVLSGKNRYQSGLYACKQFASQVVILDDGFQHRALQRDMDVILIDASNPFGHGALFPRGTLREPLQALQRADAVILSRAEVPGVSPDALRHHLRRWYDKPSIDTMSTTVEGLQQDGICMPGGMQRLHGRRIVAFSGIGNPCTFTTTLEQNGCTVIAAAVFPDHHPYTAADWHAIIELAHQQRADCLLTTEKDAVRLAPDWSAPVPLYVLRIGIRFTPDPASLQKQLLHVMAAPNP